MNLIEQYKELRQQLESDLEVLETELPLMLARRDELRELLDPAGFKVEVHSPVAFSPEKIYKDTKNLVARKPPAVNLQHVMCAFIRDNPGVTRRDINNNLRFSNRKVTPEVITKTLKRLSAGGVVENRGGKRYSAWYIKE